MVRDTYWARTGPKTSCRALAEPKICVVSWAGPWAYQATIGIVEKSFQVFNIYVFAVIVYIRIRNPRMACSSAGYQHLCLCVCPHATATVIPVSARTRSKEPKSKLLNYSITSESENHYQYRRFTAPKLVLQSTTHASQESIQDNHAEGGQTQKTENIVEKRTRSKSIFLQYQD